MHPLVHRVNRTIRQEGLISSGDRVAVAVSGGSDSVALLRILVTLARRARWELAGVIHVNHELRPEGHADQSFVARLAHELSLPLDAVAVDVPERVRRERRSVEAVARDARYECFEQAARRLGASRVATGHTQDDQAETVLLRLMRGAGTRGLSAIRARRGLYVRPLLECRRADLRDYLATLGQAFREDASNASLSIPRNRVRHRLLPVLSGMAPGGVAALARFARLAADDESLLTEQAGKASENCVQSAPDGVQVLEVGALASLPPALARRVIRSAIERAGGSATIRDIDAIGRLVRRRGPGMLDLHRLTVVRRGERLTIATPLDDPAPAAREPRPTAVLAVPGRADFGETGVAVLASFLSGNDAVSWRHAGHERVALQADAVRPPFVVRHREPGDRFRPLGAPGSRRLQDVFVDRKVPRSERDRVPVVVDDSGRIIWVAGVSIAHHCRVTMPEAGMVILELEKGHQ